MGGFKLKIPNTFVIIFFIILVAAMATWIVPGGQFERETIKDGATTRQVVVRDSFRQQDNNPQFFAVFKAPLTGMVRMADIIGFIFLVGGAFTIFQKTGAITAAISVIVRKMKGRERWVIVIIMVLFSFFGAFFGMCEEAIPFVLVFVPLALALGYDSITGLCFSFLASGVGFATAFFNPFTVQIAQRFSGIAPLSGWQYRIAIWVLVTTFTIVWVIIYAERVKKNPQKSLTYESDLERRKELNVGEGQEQVFTLRHGLVLLVLGLGIVVLFYNVIKNEWYITEIAGLFLLMGVSAGLVGRLKPDHIAEGFIQGAKDIAGAALIVGFAAGIIILLEDGNIMDTILYSLSRATGESSPVLSTYLMYGVQATLNLFIPSGTTKAALTMPIFAPLADLVGISRQTAVLAYQFGDGFTNMIIPTSGVTIGTLALAKVPFEKWFRWLLPLQLSFVGTSLILLLPPLFLNIPGF